jgi:uncharacterized protein (TIGR00730 family)
MHPQPLAYLDPEFLESDEGRPLRIMAEYLEPLRRFKAQGIQDTVVLFGSARVHSREQAISELQEVETGRHKAAGDVLAQKRKAVEWSRYYEDARTLARLITEWSISLQSPKHRFVVTSGGGPGIMEAANRGAQEAGGKTIGLNIRLPFEQGANPYITDGLHFEFHYFFMRKFWFAYMAKALVVFPGGFGTLDEMFELLTLAQTEKLEKQIQIILYGSEYWDPILKFEPMVEWGAINPGDTGLVERADTPQKAFEILRAHLTTHHLEEPETKRLQAPLLAKTRR